MKPNAKKLLLSILLICVTFHTNAQINTLYVGGYTNGDAKGEGIYTFDFNSDTGALKNKTLVAKVSSPSYLTVSSDKKTIYSVTESKNYLNSNSGAISSFKVLLTGLLEKTAEISSNGENPCHLSLSEKEDMLSVSNYNGGTFSIYSVFKEGKIDTLKQVVDLNNDSIKAHTHSAQFYKDQLFVADLGLNTLDQYSYKDSVYISKQRIKLNDKSGPRHFSITNNGDFIYVINEHEGTISTLKKDGDTYIKTNDTSTLSESYKGKNSCADIHLSEDEKTLYGSNRGENTIVVFERNKKDGSLRKKQSISSHGDWPRNFTIGPKGNFLLVANQRSSNIAIFLIDKSTGELTYIYDVKSPNPSCLKF